MDSLRAIGADVRQQGFYVAGSIAAKQLSIFCGNPMPHSENLSALHETPCVIMNSFSEPDTNKQRGRRFSVERVWRKIGKVVRQKKRQRLRKRVALTAPSPHANQNVTFSPHCLTSHDHLLMAICSAKSLNLAAEEALPWVFHDDGSLTTEDKQLLRFHFPDCHLVERSKADEFFKQPHLRTLAAARQKHVLLLKLADLHVYARRDRILYVDSDILFFKKPDTLFQVLKSGNASYFTKDISTSYIASSESLEGMTGIRPLECVNSGIFVLNRADISLDKIADALSKIEVSNRSDWTAYNHLIEQTLVAILATASPNGALHLPAEYDLYLEKGLRGTTCRHYVGVIRELFELEGLRKLLSEMEFLDRWQRFASK